MTIFQKSVINKYLKNLDEEKVSLAYDKFQKFYGDKLRLHNIMQLKEENYQEGFLREIFVQVLDYTINPDNDYNLTTEFKNQTDSRKADGAILKDGNAIGVIELKSTNTKDLESIKEQAFGYKVNQPNCKYVITSNFQNIRLYIDNATEYEEFNLFDLSIDRFKVFYLLLNKNSILNHLPDSLKQETKFHDQQITEKLYRDYKAFKYRIFEFLVSGNPQYDKLTLFKKSQKLLDRFLFILFAEDSGLIPPNSISKIIEQWKMFVENDENVSLYSRFQKFFTHLDKGHVYKQWGEIPAYNGGLFQYDDILDNPTLVLPNGLLQNHTSLLSSYDFGSEVDVNILGHIFEHSLSEIEVLTAELQGQTTDKTKSKRKKDGIFYTPKYITKYIVENTVGTLCNEKKTELKIKGLLIDDSYYQKNGKLNQKGKDLFETLQTYKKWLLTLKILDPACGSGAFLNQTLDFLINEHKEIDNIINELTGESIRYFDTDKQILENNIFGVDINEESVEIAKLSLWLRTVQRGRVLSDLSGNIKCGNSLIDDPKVAGEKAFNWNVEFKEIMENGGFDVVLGNPPYVNIENLNENSKRFIFENYQTAKGRTDIYIAFIEKSFNLANKYGYISFIVPFAITNQNYGELIRTKIIKEHGLKSITDTKYYVFEEATVKTVILVLEKTKTTDKTIIYRSETPEKLIERSHIVNQNDFLKLEKTCFETKPFNQLLKLKQKIEEKSVRLEKICFIAYGVRINSKDKSKTKDYFIHYDKKEGHKAFIEGKDIERYSHKQTAWLNYDATEHYNPMFPEMFENEKLIFINVVSDKCRFSYDDNHLYNSHTVINCVRIDKLEKAKHISAKRIVQKNGLDFAKKFELKFLLALLNSNLLNWYFINFFSEGLHFYPDSAKKMPIFKNINNNIQQPFIEKANLMLLLNKEFQTEKQNFLNTLKEEKHLQKTTIALENFNELDFEGLKKEIGKQKVRFVLGQETNEWREYFNTTKQKINELKAQIIKTDKEIDRMVYELYELIPEEIEIIENSVM